jgi:hypothetical protein
VVIDLAIGGNEEEVGSNGMKRTTPIPRSSTRNVGLSICSRVICPTRISLMRADGWRCTLTMMITVSSRRAKLDVADLPKVENNKEQSRDEE